MDRLLRVLAVLAAFLLLAGSVAQAGIVTIGPPPSVTQGNLESDDDIFHFVESTGVDVVGLSVDYVPGPPATFSGGSPPPGGSVTGKVDSHFFHYDPVGTPAAFTSPLAPTIFTFTTKILGVILSASLLDGSDGTLGNGATIYPTGAATRGIDFPAEGDLGDIFSVVDDFTISFDFLQTRVFRIDHARILVDADPAPPSAVPEPASIVAWSLLGSVFAGMGWRKRRAAAAKA